MNTDTIDNADAADKGDWVKTVDLGYLELR